MIVVIGFVFLVIDVEIKKTFTPAIVFFVMNITLREVLVISSKSRVKHTHT